MAIGTLPWSDSHGDNYRWFLLVVDLFTLLCEAIANTGQMASSILEVRTRMDLQGTWNNLGCIKNHGQLAQDVLYKSPYTTEKYL